MHGDFYAHNILCDTQGDACLGDFGAASFFSPQDPILAENLQRIEARAFGCLLQELLAHCETNDALENLADLEKIMHQCLAETPAQRPRFASLEASLQF